MWVTACGWIGWLDCLIVVVFLIVFVCYRSLHVDCFIGLCVWLSVYVDMNAIRLAYCALSAWLCACIRRFGVWIDCFIWINLLVFVWVVAALIVHVGLIDCIIIVGCVF